MWNRSRRNKRIRKIKFFFNSKINNVNHLSKTLKNLYCCGNCEIDREGIKDLDKEVKIYSSGNSKV